MRRGALVGLLIAAAAAAEPVPTSGTAQVTHARPLADLPIRGPRDAPVTVEFFCTYTQSQCAYIDDLLRQLVERHPTRLRVIYRQVVLQYKESQTLAEAGAEAFVQGKFLPFAEVAFTRHGQLAIRDLEKVAREAGLDVTALRAALADHRHLPRLERDATRRDELGAGIPGVLWNGEPLVPPLRLEEFEAVYDRAFAAAQRRLAAGVPIERLYDVLVDEWAHARIVGNVAPPAGSHPPGSAPPKDPRLVVDLDAPRAHVSVEGAPSRGPAHAPVTVVIFGDFECPFCKRQQEPLLRLEALFPGRVRVVFKHFPLAFHGSARGAAEAAACAHLQGKFWEYHDLLYKNFLRLRRPDLERTAVEAGLDPKRWKADLEAGRCALPVDADLAEGKALGVEMTPTLFVNGIKLAGVRGLSDLRVLIADELRPGLLEGVIDGTE
jgi:protein-disulfide isomerase